MRCRRFFPILIAATMLSGLLAPGAAWAANYISVAISGSAGGDTVTIADTVTGATYGGPTFDGTSWDTTMLPLNDTYIAEAKTPGGEIGLTTPFANNGSSVTGPDTHFDYTASLPLPTGIAAAATWAPGNVTTTTATITATVLSTGGPLPNVGVEISTTLPGVTLTPPSTGALVGSKVWARTDGNGAVQVGITSTTPGALVPVVLTSGGSPVSSTNVQLAGNGGAIAWPVCAGSITSSCWTNLLVSGGPAPAGLNPTVTQTSSGGVTNVNVLFTNGQAPVGDGSNAEQIVGSGSGQVPPGASISLTLNAGSLLPTALTATAALNGWGVAAVGGGYQVTVTATPTDFSQLDTGCPIGSACGTATSDYSGFLDYNVIAMAGAAAPAGYSGSVPWSTVVADMEGLALTGNAQSQARPTVDPSTTALDLQVAAPHVTAAGATNTGSLQVFVPDPLVQGYWGLTPSQLTTGSWTGTTNAEGATSALPTLTVARATENVATGTVSGYSISASGLSYSTDIIELWPLPAPVLASTAVKGGSEIDLTWNADPGTTGYQVYEATSPGGPFSRITTTPVSGTTYAVTGLAPTTTYSFRVTGTTLSGETAPSNVLTATTTPASPPAAPTGLTAQAAGPTQVQLTWYTDPSAASYNVYASPSASGPFAKINTSPVQSTTFLAANLTASTTYYFYVTGVSPSGEGAASSTATATTPILSTMTPPTGLTATATAPTQIALTWTTDPGASGYNVYSSTVATGPLTLLTSTPVTGTSYTASGLLTGLTYYFYVTAVAPPGESGPSAIATATTAGTGLTGPGGLTATAVNSNEIDLAWSAVVGASGYYVYQTTSANGTFSVLNSSPVTTPSYADTGLVPGLTYYFNVRSVTNGAIGNPSAIASATTAAAGASPSTTATLDGPTVNAILAAPPMGPNITTTVPAIDGVGSLSITGDAATALVAAGKGVTAVFGSTTLSIPPADLDPTQLQQSNPSLSSANLVGAQLVFALSPATIPTVVTDSNGLPLASAGQAFNVTAQLVTSSGVTAALSTLPQPLQVQLAYDSQQASNPGLVGVYRVSGGTTPVYAASGLANSSTVPATIASLGQYAPLEAVPTFVDTQGMWAQSQIEVAAAHHLIDGVDSSHFAPYALVTRAQFTAMLARALGLQPGDSTAVSSLPFTDVSPTAWYAGTIAAAVQDGLVTGIDATHFAPDAPVNREQVAVLIARMLALRSSAPAVVSATQQAALLGSFGDSTSIDSWAQASVAEMVADGVMNGRTPTSFAPLAAATRAEAAVMLIRALGVQ
ncbi:MAG TPA: fibronectin type III domain-containing protein [Bacillota bacterium]|nr:fibronectin type III domain-containing protein [Bacillota bacterium]